MPWRVRPSTEPTAWAKGVSKDQLLCRDGHRFRTAVRARSDLLSGPDLIERLRKPRAGPCQLLVLQLMLR